MHRSQLTAASLLRTMRQLVACSAVAVLTACGDVGGNATNASTNTNAGSATTAAGTTETPASATQPATTATSTTATSTGATSTGANAAASATTTPTPPATGESSAPASTEIGPIFVTFVSKSGSIRVELFPKEAPRTCANFLNLARRGYYIGKPWDDFSPVVRQLGTAVDLKDLPYQLPREFSPKYLFDKGGLLCLANTTEDERARGHPCRIFLTVKPQERWNLVYPVFGRVVSGLDVAESLIAGEPVAEVRVEGGSDALLLKYAKQVAEWNAILDKTPMP